MSDLFRWRVPCELAAGRAVRAALAEAPGIREVEDLMIVATELVNNAVMHSGGDSDDTIDVLVARDDDRVRVTVCDPGLADSRAHVELPGTRRIGGRGLWLVEQLAHRWGAYARDSYCVWAELALA